MKFWLKQLCLLNISQIFVDEFMAQGLKLYTNGSDSHLVVIDLRESSLSGKEGEDLLLRQHILVNRNQLPNDKRRANITSGIRLGILTLATLNFSNDDCYQLAELIASTIKQRRIINITFAKDIIKPYRVIN